jgi:hypothetical protein
MNTKIVEAQYQGTIAYLFIEDKTYRLFTDTGVIDLTEEQLPANFKAELEAKLA